MGLLNWIIFEMNINLLDFPTLICGFLIYYMLPNSLFVKLFWIYVVDYFRWLVNTYCSIVYTSVHIKKKILHFFLVSMQFRKWLTRAVGIFFFYYTFLNIFWQNKMFIVIFYSVNRQFINLRPTNTVVFSVYILLLLLSRRSSTLAIEIKPRRCWIKLILHWFLNLSISSE